MSVIHVRNRKMIKVNVSIHKSNTIHKLESKSLFLSVFYGIMEIHLLASIILHAYW